MGITQALLDNLRYIKIPKFGLHIPIEENIGTLHIPVQNLTIVQRFQSSNDLNENVPYFLFLDVCLPLLIATYFLKDITVVGVLHH